MGKSFGDYFEESMNSMGLPTPTGLFGSATTAVATIKSIQGAIAVGGDVTIAELIGAGTLSEGLAVAGGVLASFYVGACIGACIYAAGCTGIDAFAELSSEGVDLDQAVAANVDVNAYQQAGYEVYQYEQQAGDGGDTGYAAV
jgi:hypothetical protein